MAPAIVIDPPETLPPWLLPSEQPQVVRVARRAMEDSEATERRLMAQLSERRLELAAERRGTASALAAAPAEDGELRAALLKAAAAGEAEREEITAELKRVRDEFDALKWKGRWSG